MAPLQLSHGRYKRAVVFLLFILFCPRKRSRGLSAEKADDRADEDPICSADHNDGCDCHRSGKASGYVEGYLCCIKKKGKDKVFDRYK